MDEIKEKPIIYIIDDEPSVLEVLSEFALDDYEVKTFTNKKDLMDCKDTFKNVSLFIIDIQLNEKEDGIELSNELCKLGVNQPRLFISGYGNESLDELINKIKCPFDFISKPIKLKTFRNRLHIMTQIHKYHKLLINEKEKSTDMLWDMINHSLIFVIVIDSDFKIKLANYSIAKELGFDSEKDILGGNWVDFIDPSMKSVLKEVHRDIVNGGDKFKEFTSYIYSKDKKEIKVKWFNSCVNNGLNLCMSVGIPYRDIEVNESIDSIRSYFRDIIEQDRTMIQAIKQTMLKNT